MMVALAVGALPGPSASQHSHAASAKSNAVSVKLQLQGCEPDISSQVGVSLSRSATMAEAGIISLGPLESKV